MQRNSRLAALIVAVSLLAMTLVGVAVVSPIGAQSPDDAADRTIAVSATGSADAAPDRAVVRVAATAEGDDPAAVRDALSADADALRSNLETAGITEYETADYRIGEPRRPPRPPEGGEQRGPAYEGTHSFEVTLDDPDRVGAVIDAAADAGVEVDVVEFTLSDALRDDLREAAIEDAMGDARSQADTIAANGGLAVTSVASVDATGRNFRPIRYELEAADAAGSATGIETGDVSVEYAVTVEYNATG